MEETAMSAQAHAVEDPFRSMSQRVSQIINEVTQRRYYRFSRSAAWEPAVNIQEDEDHLYLCVELAGLSDDAIVVEMANRKLQIRGERSVTRPPGSKSPTCILHKEINSGAFERIIDLPDCADPDDIEAKLEAGFLWITINKRIS